MIKISLKYTG